MIDWESSGNPDTASIQSVILIQDNRQLKAQKRLTSLITVGVLFIFLVLGANFITLMPRPILGGLLVYLGLSLCFVVKRRN